ncbi:MAG TPA: hypothetical protein VNV44_07375 [Solirubrobacteraceae bacterium]|jgi:hypothetical protein|nr:hypothetical protein [Solirubrobacteraceae bacterium]
MRTLRSWNPSARALLVVLALASAAGATGVETAAARRNVNLEAGSEPAQTSAPAAESPSAQPEAPAGEGGGETGSRRHGHGGRRGGCAVTLEAPHSSSAGEAPTVTGKLTCAEAGEAAGAPVQILERTAGRPGFATAATELTEPDGSYAATLAPADADVYLYARAGHARSPRQAIRITPLVTLAGPATGAVLPMARRRSSQSPITFSGTVSPADAGALVTLQRERPNGSGSWRRVAFTRVGEDGSFSFSHLFRIPGPLELRAFVHRHDHRLPAVSETLSYEVAQPQNPSLTISASPADVPFGSPVTISGRLAAPAGSPVALLTLGGGGPLTTAASTGTESGGAYSFTQTPNRDTAYRVSGGAQSSATVRVQVSFAVTAVPSASTVAPGEGVTITGTVAPASPGARVYLRRPARTATGYQTLGYATVQPDSTYAIAVPASTPGSAVYRVQAPQLGAMHAGASAPVTVVTTPAAEASPGS